MKIFKKIARAAIPSNAEGITDTTKTTVSGSPKAFIATNYYPIILAFSSRNAPLINGLTNILNNALYYSSNGKIEMDWMKNANFNFDISNTPSEDLRNLMGFAKQLYLQVYTNNGQLDKRALTAQEISGRLNPLKFSQYLNNMNATGVTSQLNTKIGGNTKTLINNYLSQIK
jgi:hypothetical protein